MCSEIETLEATAALGPYHRLLQLDEKVAAGDEMRTPRFVDTDRSRWLWKWEAVSPFNYGVTIKPGTRAVRRPIRSYEKEWHEL